jgi:hypothetical protein
MSVRVKTEPKFEAAAPQVLFETRFDSVDATSDGRRFLVVHGRNVETGPETLEVIVNWKRALESQLKQAK